MSRRKEEKRRPRRLRMAAVAAVAAAFLALGVGAAAPALSATASKTASVQIVDFAFHPGTLRIAKGATVVFSNTASRAHTATDPGTFDTGRIKGGHSASVRFNEKGTFSFHCKIHPFMHGKIVVG